MKIPKQVPLTPPTPPMHLNAQPQTPMSQMQSGQLNPMTDLHKMAMGVAMSNMLRRKKNQTPKITG